MASLETDLVLKENPSLIELSKEAVTPGTLGLISLAGSRSYGLSHKDSDLDLRGFFIAPSEDFLGLFNAQEQYISKEPDAVFYEIGKFSHLALKANPVALEALFTEDQIYVSPEAQELIDARALFLSQRVRTCYVGYATSQLVRVERELKGGVSVDRFKEATRAKHLRHIFRLLDQGYELVSTGHLSVRISDPDSVLERAALPLEEIRALMDAAIVRIDEVPSPLPEHPDTQAVSDLIVSIRKRF